MIDMILNQFQQLEDLLQRLEYIQMDIYQLCSVKVALEFQRILRLSKKIKLRYLKVLKTRAKNG